MAGKQVATVDRPDSGAIVISEATRAKLVEVFEQIPDAEGEGAERLLLQLLNADSWEQLDDPWDTERSKAWIGKDLIVRDLIRRPSDYTDGLAWFLVVFAVNPVDGQEVVLTSGSFAVASQLAIAYTRGWLPLHVTWLEAERPTKDGYKPHHLRINGKG